MTTNPTRILVVDDDAAMREVLEMRLQEWGFDVCLASDGNQARELTQSYEPDIVISDVLMPGLSGLELLRFLKMARQAHPVILITVQASVDVAVEAMKQGAQDFLIKPLDYCKLKSTLECAKRDIRMRRGFRKLGARLEQGAGFREFIGTSKEMRQVYDFIKVVAKSDAPVLITGESGTGKELAARTLHELSPRSHGPFIAINSAAIPESLIETELFGHERGAFTGAVAARPGCFELADQGTLFLDEIAEMPLPVQAKLLRVLEDGRVRRVGSSEELRFNVRVLAATNLNPRDAVQKRTLREDLYFRLNIFTLTLPVLHHRREDIPLLAQHFIGKFNQRHQTAVVGLSSEALERLQKYSWPGNVRELKNVMERAVIVARKEWIDPAHLPPHIQSSAVEADPSIILPLGVTAAEAEKELILKTLMRTGNNKAEAARRLGVDVKTIRNKLKTYRLN